MTVLRALLCLLAVSVAAPASAEDATRFLAGGHVSLAVPAGWITCDEGSGRRTGNGVAGDALGQLPCHEGDPDHYMLNDTDPNAVGFVAMIADVKEGATRKLIAEMPPGFLPEMVDRLCKRAESLAPLTYEACDAAPTPVAGEPALMGSVTGTTAKGARTHMRFALVPYEGGTLFLVGMEMEGRPTLGAIFDTIEVN